MGLHEQRDEEQGRDARGEVEEQQEHHESNGNPGSSTHQEYGHKLEQGYGLCQEGQQHHKGGEGDAGDREDWGAAEQPSAEEGGGHAAAEQGFDVEESLASEQRHAAEQHAARLQPLEEVVQRQLAEIAEEQAQAEAAAMQQHHQQEQHQKGEGLKGAREGGQVDAAGNDGAEAGDTRRGLKGAGGGEEASEQETGWGGAEEYVRGGTGHEGESGFVADAGCVSEDVGPGLEGGSEGSTIDDEQTSRNRRKISVVQDEL